MVRINSRDPQEFSAYPQDLPDTDILTGRQTLFGGEQVERRTGMILLAFSIVTAIGFIIGALLTLGILSGWIEIDPKAVKTFFKTIVGKN